MIDTLRRLDGARLAQLLGAQERRWFERRVLPVYAITLAAAATIVLAVASGRWGYDPRTFANVVPALLFFIAVAWTARWIGFTALAGCVEVTAASLLSVFLIGFCSAIFLASDRPLADPWLGWIDERLVGFHHGAVTAWFARTPALMRATVWVYDSLAFTPQLLFFLLFLTRRARDAWTLFTAMTIALALSVCITPLFPAFGTPPYAYRFVEVLTGVRDGHLRVLGEGVMSGMVTFPSLHAADAAILAWAYARCGRWAAPFVVLNLLMIVSAVVVGGHYLSDIVAGLGVAWVAIRLALTWQDRLDRVARG